MPFVVEMLSKYRYDILIFITNFKMWSCYLIFRIKKSLNQLNQSLIRHRPVFNNKLLCALMKIINEKFNPFCCYRNTRRERKKKSSYSFEINFLKYKTSMIKIKNKLFWTKPGVQVTIPTWILDLSIGTVNLLSKGLTSLRSTDSFAVEHFLIPNCFIAKHRFIDRIKLNPQLNHLFNIWSS